MQRENRERNFNNTHRLKVGCVMRYSTVPWNPGFSSKKSGNKSCLFFVQDHIHILHHNLAKPPLEAKPPRFTVFSELMNPHNNVNVEEQLYFPLSGVIPNFVSLRASSCLYLAYELVSLAISSYRSSEKIRLK